MTVEDGIALVEQILINGRLSRVQELVFRQAWEGHSYLEIADASGYDAGYVKDVGAALWRSLSDAAGEKVTKQNFQGVLKRAKWGSGENKKFDHSSFNVLSI